MRPVYINKIEAQTQAQLGSSARGLCGKEGLIDFSTELFEIPMLGPECSVSVRWGSVAQRSYHSSLRVQ